MEIFYQKTGTILDKICEKKRKRLLARLGKGAGTARAEIRGGGAAGKIEANKPRNFLKALTGPELAVIAEIKQASPSAGKIVRGGKRGGSEFSAAAIAQNYEKHGAAAISVLTEEDFFHGSLDFLQEAGKVTRIPLLCKDFILHPVQIEEARSYGADAVLLIAAILAPQQLKELSDKARELGMEALVEIHNETELEQVLGVIRPRILGINNRDLKTMQVDLGNFGQLAALARKQTDSGTVLVAESGIKSREDALAAVRSGADAILVGTTLMKAADPGKKLEELRGTRPEIKFCGMKRPEDIKEAIELGVDYVGVVVEAKGTPRSLELDEALELFGYAREQRGKRQRPKLVAVVTDLAGEKLEKLVGSGLIDVVQFHLPAEAEALELCNKWVECWQVVQIKDGTDLDALAREMRERSGQVQRWVLDASDLADKKAGRRREFKDFSAFEKLREQGGRLILAGGLKPENVRDYCERSRPEMVDVSSGIEERPGVKSAKKMREFIKQINSS